MKKTLNILRFTFISLLWLTVFNVQASTEASTETTTTEAGFQAWLIGFKQQARAAGISESTLNQAFQGVHMNQKILDSDRKQPEFISTFWEYFERAVNPRRIIMGQQYYLQNKALLDAVTRKYGVPGHILVAFWGMETNYGSYTGYNYIIESLATLAYDPRRSAFFSKELMSALQIIERGEVTPEKMKGSWAGAMGQCQFMPSNYLKYAVDGDGDGKVNLWDSLPDVMYSAGNFLQSLGWERDGQWGQEVRLPNHFNYALADGKTPRSIQEWRQLGIRSVNNAPLPSAEVEAHLIMPSDYRGPAFLVYAEFKVIKRWNNSSKYALAVGHLSERILGGRPLMASKPWDDKGMSIEQMKEIQILLMQQGYEVGEADGISGSKTRNALREFQMAHNLPADGHPSLTMLEKLTTVQNAKASAPAQSEPTNVPTRESEYRSPIDPLLQ